ncbi:MAG: hypothetical protein ACFFEF_00835 [Candidatus Thorarchaeota archaeon]
MKELTEGSISRVINGMISIRDFQESVNIQDGSVVLIVRSRSGFLRVIPISGGSACHVRVSLDLTSFTSTSRMLYDTIREMDLRLLHSTGFCPFENVCIWEGYFLVKERSNIEEFIKWLRGLNVVLEIEILPLMEKE